MARYTAQQMRDMAKCLHYNRPTKLTIEAAAMLCQSADAMEHSQTETSVRYEYALQEKFRGVWRVDLTGFSSLDESEDYINMMCEINPDREFRIVRRPAEWEVVE